MSIESAKRVLKIEAAAIEGLMARLDGSFDRAVEVLLGCTGRVVVSGMGKSGLIGRKIAATFSSTGTPSLFMHPAEAMHGDLGMLVRDDVLLALSYSGENDEILQLIETVKRLGVKLVSLTGNIKSNLAAASDVALDVSVKEEACSLNLAPTASTTATLAMGDALAIVLLERRGFGPDDFAALHPGGRLGRQLQRAENLMHAGEALPKVATTAKMPEVIYEMSKKGLGLATVVDAADKLAGIVTDGDLRRLMQARGGEVLGLAASDCMTRNPVTIGPKELASAALKVMEEKKITSVVVTDEQKRVLGVLHVHDLWTLQLF